MRSNATLRHRSSLFTAAASLVASAPHAHALRPTTAPSPPPPVNTPRLLERPSGRRRGLSSHRRSSRRLEEAISLLKYLASAMGIPTDIRSHWLLVSICRHHVDLGLGALGDALKRGSPDGARLIVNYLIDGLCTARRYDDALKLFDRVIQMGFPLDKCSGGAIVRCMCRNGDVGRAVQLLREWRQCLRLELSAYNVVLDRLRRWGAVHEAIEMFRGMIWVGASPDAVAYNALVKCCCNAGHLDLALELLCDFFKRGCEAKRGMLNTLIGRLAEEGRIADASALFCWMPAMGCVANVFTCNALIKGLCQAGNAAAALKLYREMSNSESSCQPNMFTYNTLTDCLCKEGHLNEAVNILHEMIVQGLLPNVVTFNILMDFLCKRRWIQEAHELFHVVARRKMVPTEITYNILIHGYCLTGQMDTAKRIFDSMFINGIRPNIFSYNILCNGYCKNRKMEYAKLVLIDMAISGISPNLVTSTILIDAYCKRGKLRQALDYIDNMIQNGLDPSVIAYSSVINAYCLRGDMNEAFKIMGRMKCQPDAIFYSIILKGYCNRREITEALKIFDEMWCEGLNPNVIACTTLLNGFFLDNKPFSALELHKKMESWGIKSTEVTYKVMVAGIEDALQVTNGDVHRKVLEDRAKEIYDQLEHCQRLMHSDLRTVKSWMKNLVE